MSNHGIHIIDTGFNRPRFDAAYLIVENGRGAFVDCGTNHSVPRLMRALESAALEPENVDWLILTHVHLDHAGGAGALMTRLPNARVLVHPRGARHMIDPSRLWAGASAVYGEQEMQRSYGRLVPIPAERVIEVADGATYDLGGRPLEFMHSPGHAKHHHCIWDAASQSWFTGDTFGLSYREFDSVNGPFIIPTTTPIDFDPAALHASIERLLKREPRAMYLTHFARVTDISRMARDLHARIDDMVALALRLRSQPERYQAMAKALGDLYVRCAEEHGCPLDRGQILALLANDIELNAQGLDVWLERRDRA